MSAHLRVAAIDIGSNAIRFAVAELDGGHTYRVVEQKRAAVRLGSAVLPDGRLERRAADAALQALKYFRSRMEDLGIVRYRAVATSALRESSDGEAFRARARAGAGVEIEPITATEEARLVHVAVAASVPLGTHRWLLIDVGGGSVELSLIDAAEILWSESRVVGAVRLLAEVPEGEQAPDRWRRLIERHMAPLRISEIARRERPVGLLAVGGNIEALARLAGADSDAGAYRLSTTDLGGIISNVAPMPFQRRVEELGLSPDRADVILPAALLYEYVARQVGVRDVVVTWVGVKEGILFQLAEQANRVDGGRDGPAR